MKLASLVNDARGTFVVENHLSFTALQSFPTRGAQFRVGVLDGGRVSLVGNAVTVVRGELELPHKSVFYEPSD